MARKKVVFISGPITGVTEYYKAFEAMEDELEALGFIGLSPTRLPNGLTDPQYMRICLSMIDAADGVIFLPGWNRSTVARLEREYCLYMGKRVFTDLNYLVEVLG